jgi:hypothetical protein
MSHGLWVSFVLQPRRLLLTLFETPTKSEAGGS